MAAAGAAQRVETRVPETMDALALALAAGAAGLGAVCRLLLDGLVTSRLARSGRSRALPWGTIAVNVSGSFAIGIIAGIITLSGAATGTLTHAALAGTTWPMVAVLGFLSGYTTFSTVSYQTVRLAWSGRWGAAFSNGIGQLVVASAAVALGWASAWAGAQVIAGVVTGAP